MTILDIPIYDIIMAAVLLFTVVYGAIRGFVWQMASLLALVLSCWAAIRWSPILALVITTEAPWNRYAAMLIIFVVCSLIIWLLFRVIAKWLERVRLEGFDRQMGALFGLLKGVLFCLIITFFGVSLSAGTRRLVFESRSGVFLAGLIPKAVSILPEELRQPIGEYLKEFQDRLQAVPPGLNGQDQLPPGA